MQIVWWDGALRPEDRVRVIAWTCDCRKTVYELCRAAGQSYIRRTFRKNREVHEAKEVHETYRWTFREAEKVWNALLAGHAR